MSCVGGMAMTNFYRAVKALEEADKFHGAMVDNEAYVRALEAAGLLAPDLPEPYRPGIFKVVSPYLGIRSVQAAEDQIVLHGYKTRHAVIGEARRLALALLAACEYAEKEQDNER